MAEWTRQRPSKPYEVGSIPAGGMKVRLLGETRWVIALQFHGVVSERSMVPLC